MFLLSSLFLILMSFWAHLGIAHKDSWGENNKSNLNRYLSQSSPSLNTVSPCYTRYNSMWFGPIRFLCNWFLLPDAHMNIHCYRLTIDLLRLLKSHLIINLLSKFACFKKKFTKSVAQFWQLLLFLFFNVSVLAKNIWFALIAQDLNFNLFFINKMNLPDVR